jgi:integrase
MCHPACIWKSIRAPRNGFRFQPTNFKALFASPLYTGFEGAGKEHLPGTTRADDWRKWLPLLALFTGARLGELSQLHTTDVRKLHDRWIIHITDEGREPGAEKSLKTDGSACVVPIHPELVRLGFLDYHARIVASGAKRLFPDLKADARGFQSGDASGFFRRYFARIGIKKDRTLTFHSFRHGFADALRRAGFRDERVRSAAWAHKGDHDGTLRHRIPRRAVTAPYDDRRHRVPKSRSESSLSLSFLLP